jgi:toxin ParE1/3/4
MSRYVLTPTAQEDLAAIRDYYMEQAGARIARQMLAECVEAFRFLARTPGAGHKREDLAGDRSVLFWAMRDYLIVYAVDGGTVQVVMIARGSRDVPSILTRRGL